MGEMREWWANVYPHVADPVKIGGKFKSRLGCEAFRGDFAAFRIHVRLKPNGAPERYASEQDRQWWEKLYASSKQQAALRQRLETDINTAHGHLWLTDPALDGRRPPEMIARVEADIRTRFPSV